jgi:hypothetical protein
MKIIKYLSYLLGLAIMASACSKEEKLTPSELVVEYQLPQGNHDYDPALVQLHQKYGTFFLYKFSKTDFGATPVYVEGGNFIDTYAADVADEAYVANSLAFIQKNWLAYYPDAFLKQQLPFKVLLAKNVRGLKSPFTKYNVLWNSTQFTISNFSADFDAMTIVQKRAFMQNIHEEFWNYMLARTKIEISPEFLTVSNYAQTGVTAANMYSYGFLTPTISFLSDKMNVDFKAYFKVITSTTKAQLDATILNPTTDVNGLVKKKYDFIINYYKTKYNIDLQAIGNAGVL